MDEGKIIFGQDYRNQFAFCHSDYPDQDAVKFNLRKSRQGLLFAEHDSKIDYELFLAKFGKSLDAVSRGSKQILSFADGKLRKNRFSAVDLIPELFPDVNIEPLKRIKHLYANHDELDELYHNKKEILRLWDSSLTTFEQLIRSYIRQYPKKI